MKRYKRHARFFIVFFLFTAAVAGVRFYWIHNALLSKATVLYTDHTRFTSPIQYYPVVSYDTFKGNIVTRGTYNLPINTGQTVDILYNPDDVQEFRLNTSYWLWYDIWSWYRLALIGIAMYYLVLLIVKRNLRRTTQHAVENKKGTKPPDGFDLSRVGPAMIERFGGNHAGKAKANNHRVRMVKAALLLLLPVGIFLIGQIWDLPYATQIAVVVFLGLVAVGSPSGSASDGDF